MPKTTTSRDGTAIAYDIAGDGVPLVYVTGALCHRRMREVRRDAKVFSERFRVITFDRRGRGDSGPGGAWSLDRELDDVEALLDVAGDRAVIYGHSSGAVIALPAAARFAGRVDAVALYDAAWAADDAEVASYRGLTTEVDGLLERGRNAAAIRRFLVGIGMPRVFTYLLPVLPQWSTMKQLAPTLRYDMALTATPPPLDTVADVATAVHILVGERSPRELHAVATALAGARQGVPTVVAGQNHLASPAVILPLLTAISKAAT